MGINEIYGKKNRRSIQMKPDYKNDDKINKEIKRLLNEEFLSLEEASLSKILDRAVSKEVSRK